MRITEKKLRSLVGNVISEMSSYTLQAGSTDISKLAEACCELSSEQLFMLCSKIYTLNSNTGGFCAELCAFALNGDGDHKGCEECLRKICEYEECAKELFFLLL